MCNERTRKGIFMEEWGKVVDGNEVGSYDAIFKIICGDRCKEVILVADGCEDDKFMSLNDCLDLIEYDRESGMSVIVIIDSWLHGTIYRYGAYSEKYWEVYGETGGFA